MLLLACVNAMKQAATTPPSLPDAVASFRFETASGVAPLGVVVSALVLVLLRDRTRRVDRALALVLGALCGGAVGALAGLPLRVSAAGMAAVPLVVLALIALEVAARASRAVTRRARGRPRERAGDRGRSAGGGTSRRPGRVRPSRATHPGLRIRQEPRVPHRAAPTP